MVKPAAQQYDKTRTRSVDPRTKKQATHLSFSIEKYYNSKKKQILNHYPPLLPGLGTGRGRVIMEFEKINYLLDQFS